MAANGGGASPRRTPAPAGPRPPGAGWPAGRPNRRQARRPDPTGGAGLLGRSTAFLLRDPVAAVGARLHRAAVLAHADEAGEQAPLRPGDHHVDAVTNPIAAQPHLAGVAGLGEVLLGSLPGLGRVDPVGIAGTGGGEIQLAGAGSGGLLGDVDSAPLGGE